MITALHLLDLIFPKGFRCSALGDMLRVVAVLGLFWHASTFSPSLQDGAILSSLSVQWQHPNGY